MENSFANKCVSGAEPIPSSVVPQLMPIGILWDINNLQVPFNRSVIKLVQRIRRVVFDTKYRESEFQVVCDINKANNKVIDDLNSSQVTVIHINSKAKNAADDKIKQLIHRFIETFGHNSGVVVITVDVNFACVWTDLKYHLKVGVTLIQRHASPALINSANTVIDFNHLIDSLPLRSESQTKESSVLVTNLPNGRKPAEVKKLLNKFSSNCGGKKISINCLKREAIFEVVYPLIEIMAESRELELLNITDETPVNYQRFLDENGMHYFMSCMNSFPHNTEVLVHIMNLLANIAESAHLRKRLMNSIYICKFIELLDSEGDGKEVNFYSAGILSFIASEGPQCWQQYLPIDCKRETMLSRMKSAIKSWKINSEIGINYRSFEPILRLLSSDVSYGAHYWALWALTNRTRVNCEEYFPLLEDNLIDGKTGIEILRSLLRKLEPNGEDMELLAALLGQYHLFKKKGNLGNLKNSEVLELPRVRNEKF